MASDHLTTVKIEKSFTVLNISKHSNTVLNATKIACVVTMGVDKRYARELSSEQQMLACLP